MNNGLFSVLQNFCDENMRLTLAGYTVDENSINLACALESPNLGL